MDMRMILFGNSLNAGVRKVLCCAALRGIKLDQMSLVKGSDDPVFRASSPAGVIPALRHANGSLSGALAIIDHLDGVGHEEPMIPMDREVRSHAFSVAQVADGPLAQVVSAIFQNIIFLPRFLGKPGNMQLVSRLSKGALPRALEAAEAAIVAPGAPTLRRRLDAPGLAEVAIFSQGVALMLSGKAASLDRHSRVYEIMSRLIVDPHLEQILARDARLSGIDASGLGGISAAGAEMKAVARSSA